MTHNPNNSALFSCTSVFAGVIDLVSRKLPLLDPGVLPKTYFTLSATHQEASSLTHDLDAERAERSTASLIAPAPPVQPDPDPLTKKEKKAVCCFSHPSPTILQ